MSWIVLPRESLADRFLSWGVDVANCPPILPAANYALPRLEWVTGQFRDDWLVWSRQYFSGFEEGAEVCFDYVRECASFAALQFRRTKDRPSGCRLAFGEFFFRIDEGAGEGCAHAVCPFVPPPQDEGDLLSPYFFDAWPAQLRDLNRVERESCQFARLG